jgi:DNA-binding XRE family transcriptional regulator
MSKVNEVIKKQEHKNFVFTPNDEFYKTVGITNRRWAKICRGETAPTLPEAKAIAQFFEVPVTDLIE